MRRNIENNLVIEVEGAALTGWSEPELYIRQGCRFLQYTPSLVDDSHISVTVPWEEERQLNTGPGQIQLAYTDANGVPQASEIEDIQVGELLKEAGFGNQTQP